MKNRKVRIVTYAIGILVLTSSLWLIAQTKQTKKVAKQAAPKPTTVAHPFGPANIEVNFATCQLQQPLIHADPGGKIHFSSVNAPAGGVTVDITPPGFLSQDKVSIPQNGTAPPVNVLASSGTGHITIENCTAPPLTTKERKKGKGPFTSDPNDIIVP